MSLAFPLHMNHFYLVFLSPKTLKQSVKLPIILLNRHKLANVEPYTY